MDSQKKCFPPGVSLMINYMDLLGFSMHTNEVITIRHKLHVGCFKLTSHLSHYSIGIIAPASVRQSSIFKDLPNMATMSLYVMSL